MKDTVASVVSLSALVVVLGGCSCLDGPLGGIPGGRLRTGPLMSEPVVDWSFADNQDVEVQLVEPPTSRTTWLWVHEGQLYVPCDLGLIKRMIPAPERWGASLVAYFKHWHRDALRDGRVVLRIAGKRYERQAVRVTDPELLAALTLRLENWAVETFPSRLAEMPTSGPDDVWFFRMDPRPTALSGDDR